MNSKLPTILFGIVACTFSHNLSRNNCMRVSFCNRFPFRRAFSRLFLILVLVNLLSTELSVLSLKKIPQNKGGNLRLIPVRGFGTVGIFSCNLSHNLLRHELKKKNFCCITTKYKINPNSHRSVNIFKSCLVK